MRGTELVVRKDLWRHVYEPDEIHFEFQFGEYVLAAADAVFTC